VDIEAKLASVLFQKRGCIYYKADLPAKGDPVQNLEASISDHGDAPTKLPPSLIDKFAIGPLTQAVLWEGERATMALDRGPCKLILLAWIAMSLISEGRSAVDCMTAMRANEM
jgi:hypothetical protein